jgi:hypothetical protein
MAAHPKKLTDSWVGKAGLWKNDYPPACRMFRYLYTYRKSKLMVYRIAFFFGW